MADAAGKKFAEEPVVGVVIGALVVVLVDLATWAIAIVAASHQVAGRFAAFSLLGTFPVIGAFPVAVVLAIAAVLARRPWISLGALVGCALAVILLPGQCMVAYSVGWLK